MWSRNRGLAIVSLCSSWSLPTLPPPLWWLSGWPHSLGHVRVYRLKRENFSATNPIYQTNTGEQRFSDLQRLFWIAGRWRRRWRRRWLGLEGSITESRWRGKHEAYRYRGLLKSTIRATPNDSVLDGARWWMLRQQEEVPVPAALPIFQIFQVLPDFIRIIFLEQLFEILF